ncbi:hypothetical protein HK099_000547 [Clydaea vesicula]|uniref:Uncharacterized protein n=1 Tax=Clydaea vesicula TaxID=447962 RepID=A0AAD5TZB0_9FUNG|nr:hypothetical protein HK099_000547 [Clydaea vesicula]KAJ3390617.1 hypothetical protein HDU92_000370 [Lobulomyces angularis]
MKFLITILSVISILQSQSLNVPATCETECNAFSDALALCAINGTAPTTATDWAKTAQTVSTCVCPKFSQEPSCQECLQQNSPNATSSTLFFDLKSDCDANKTDAIKDIILNIWGKSDNATNATTSTIAIISTTSSSSNSPTASVDANQNKSGALKNVVVGLPFFYCLALFYFF